MMRPSWMFVCAALLTTTAAASARAPVVTPQHDPPPVELAAPLRALIAPGGQQVTIGSTTLDFWWVESLPLAAGSSGAVDWSQVPEGSLVGVMKTGASFPDIRGHSFKAGVYTLRYGIQPADGNHMGVSPYPDFLLVGPAADDTDPKPLGHDATIQLSTKASGLAHPAVLSLDPPVATQALDAVVQPEQGMSLTSVIFAVPVSRGGVAAGTLRFGLVLVGIIQP
ncbi:MAG TPA: hypothetical protein VNE16_05505 [Vicinamibacterales bacterium]|nr:hypothetical protein [Vicinamibacterales bacterium]